MKRVMKRLFLVAVFVMLFGLMGCGTTLTTNMSVSDNFAGTRTMNVSIDKETFDEHAPEDGFTKLASETLEKTPSCMKFTYEEKQDEYVFHFVMSFTSKEEYEEQVFELLKEQQEVEFVYTKSPFAKEITLKESFASEDLLSWFRDYLVEKEYLEKEDAPHLFSTVKNDFYVNGQKFECNQNCINITQKSYIPIKSLNIFSDMDVENEKIARKIELVFEEYVIKTNRETIEQYLSHVTPGGCVGEWQVVEEGEKFVLLIPHCTEEEMSAAMKIFCSSENSEVKLVLAGEEDVVEEAQVEGENESYSDMWDQQVLGTSTTQKNADSDKYVQPFGYETTLEENLDLSAFVNNSWGEVQSVYYVSAKNGKPRSMLYYPNNEEKYGWDYIDEKNPDYYYVETSWMPKYQVVSDVNKYYVPTSVQMNTTVKSADKIVREFVFIFDEEFDKNTINKIMQKSDMLFEEHKKLIDVSVNNRKDKANIKWEIAGDIEAVDEFCKEVFGMGYSNISYYCQDRFVLNRQYDYKEIIDFRPIFDWEYNGNVDYTLRMTGKVNKDNSQVVGGIGAPAKISGKTVNYLSTESAYLDARVTGTTVNKVLAYLIGFLIVFGVQIVWAVVVFVKFKGEAQKVTVKRKPVSSKTKSGTVNKSVKNKKKRP